METTETTTQTVQPVKLYSRCEAAVWDPSTNEVNLTPNVDPKFLIRDLIQDIQTLTKQVNDLKTQLTDTTTEKTETEPVEGEKL